MYVHVVAAPRRTQGRLGAHASRRRARSLARAATANASERGARTATASARVATVRSSRQPGVQPTLRRSVRLGEQATSSTCKRKAGRAGDVEDKRGAEQSSGVARGAAARRHRGQDGAANIAATGSCSISRYSSVNHRVEKATGMRLLSQATQLSINALRTLKSDESAGHISLLHTAATLDSHPRQEPGPLRT
jgi:hypothetical protein